MFLSRKKLGMFSCLTLWRLTSVFLVQTAHVPDEYWQSLEVAHRMAFGYGHLTWEWSTMIRSYAYPFLISLLYRALAALSLDVAWLLTVSPRVCQALLAAYADHRFYEWTGSKWMLFVLCTNWYWYYCATRTLINAVETVCTVVALSMFPWRDGQGARGIEFLWIVGLLCMARPTAAIVWAPLCAYHVCTSGGAKGGRTALLRRYAAICFACFAISVSIDSCCYGTLVITPWEFFRANVLAGAGGAYGEQPAFWYVYAGLPVLLGLYCVPLAFAVWRIIRRPARYHRESVMLAIVAWTLTVYSLLPHKEFRFVLPLLPMLIAIASITGRAHHRPRIRLTEFARKGVLALFVCSNLAPGLYFSLIHQRGTLDATSLLRDELSRARASTAAPTDTLILTPCHATPLYSHLHVNASVRFLTCEPNRDGAEDYADEADRFFANPASWLDDRYYYGVAEGRVAALPPTYVMVFDNVAAKITRFLDAYELIARVFHAHFPQSNYGRYVLLYKIRATRVS